MDSFFTGIGDILAWASDAFYNDIFPMINTVFRLLSLPLKDAIVEFDSLWWISDILSFLIDLLWDDVTLLQIMIGSAISLYIWVTIYRFVKDLIF